jgi:uncharacterized membrane protein
VGFRAGAAVLAAAEPGENGDMNKAIFIKQLDHPAIEACIARAEKMTSGEIRVAVIQKPAGNPLSAAREIFAQLGMTKTKDRNAVLIFVAPSSQTFAVVGDEGVHQKCGADFWRELTASMETHFKQGNFTAGLLQGIERAGQLLATHFPRNHDDKNELPDTVIEG